MNLNFTAILFKCIFIYTIEENKIKIFITCNTKDTKIKKPMQRSLLFIRSRDLGSQKEIFKMEILYFKFVLSLTRDTDI